MVRCAYGSKQVGFPRIIRVRGLYMELLRRNHGHDADFRSQLHREQLQVAIGHKNHDAGTPGSRAMARKA